MWNDYIILILGSMYSDIRLPVPWSYTSYPGSLFSFISSLTLSNHLLLCLPLLRIPCTFIFIAPPLFLRSASLHECTYHFNPLSWTFFAIAPTILPFLILLSFVTPHIYRSSDIYATSNYFSCTFFKFNAILMSLLRRRGGGGKKSHIFLKCP